MTEIEIKHLQTENRFSDGGLKNFYLLLYLPVGFVIAIIRIILGLVVIILGNVLPDVSIVRNVLSHVFRAIFGIIVHTENNLTKDNVKVIISNYISPLDHFIAHIATGCISPSQTNLPKQLSNSLGINTFGTSTNIEEIKKSITNHIINDPIPILFQPENKITNGNAILKFKEWPFSLTNEVQPIYLKIRRPIFDISVTTITSTYWSDVFWYLFSPWTVYNIKFLTVVKKDGLDDAAFAEKVRQEIANALEVTACPYDASEVLEWEKRYLLEQRRSRMVHLSSSNTSLSNNPELHRMARQVKEVLPAVPYNIIFKDLARTKNVDITISNILEGHIQYTPEEIPSPTSPSSSSPPATPSVSAIPILSEESCRKAKDSLCTAAATFPKSAQERMQSFQERKMQLILNARKRYMDKHGLNALASNNC